MPRKKFELTPAQKKIFFMARVRGESLRDCAETLGICYATCQKIPREKWYKDLEKGTEAFVSAWLEATMND